ncbi:hypothetical protein [Mesobacterium pallidum]|uniref:hypothetical protein n=1 Tax=Mesobacterium pallidum TaxID=2872037 RepID=UPI001EE23836|nr:hypothetical protein [Mesobacterium pallidum]
MSAPADPLQDKYGPGSVFAHACRVESLIRAADCMVNHCAEAMDENHPAVGLVGIISMAREEIEALVVRLD